MRTMLGDDLENGGIIAFTKFFTVITNVVEELNIKAFGGSLSRRDVVGDLGSGYGLMLMLIAALYGSRVIGIEISETRHLGGLQILLELMERMSMGERSVELLHGDMLDSEFTGRLSELTKLIVNNKVRSCSGWPAPKGSNESSYYHRCSAKT